MPRFGEAHKLLSPTHPDTEAPAAGADPDDGQVATWSAALKAWIAADPTGDGVSDHGLLTGLGDDDHPHYALADKSRPSPWVAAADLSARSLQDLGTRHHHHLEGLADDDHPHYALADKSRPDPWVAAADLAARSIADLGTRTHSLLTGKDADDHPQYAAIAQDEVISGNWRFNGWNAINFAPAAGSLLKVSMNKAGVAAGINVSETAPGGAGGVTAIYGFFFNNQPAGVTAPKVSGLNFAAMTTVGSGTVSELAACRVQAGQFASAATMTDIYAFLADTLYSFSGSPSSDRSHGLRIKNQGRSWVDTAFGLLIEPQSGAGANYDMWIGAAYGGTPNLRMDSGAPAANQTMMILNFGGTLYRLTRNAATGAVETAAV